VFGIYRRNSELIRGVGTYASNPTLHIRLPLDKSSVSYRFPFPFEAILFVGAHWPRDLFIDSADGGEVRPDIGGGATATDTGQVMILPCQHFIVGFKEGHLSASTQYFNCSKELTP